MRLSRRVLLLGLAGAGASAATAAAWHRRSRIGQVGPCAAVSGERIRWIVPNAPGGGYDAESRLLEPLLEKRLGAELVVDNIPGAGGIVGARALAAAPPDGRTLGFVGVPGLLVAALSGEPTAPDPTRFTILGRLTRSRFVWATGRRSRFRSLDDVVATGAADPVVFGVSEVGSANFVAIAVSAALVGVPAALVPGFGGTRQATLAALAGDVDLVCFNFETIRDLIEAGDLRPLLQVSDAPAAEHPSLSGVPLLGGTAGRAARAARARGDDPSGAERLASNLAALLAAGRVVIGPPQMPAATASCLGRVIGDALTSDELARSAKRRLDPARADEATRDIAAAAAGADALLPIVARARRAAREGS